MNTVSPRDDMEIKINQALNRTAACFLELSKLKNEYLERQRINQPQPKSKLIRIK